MKIILCDDQVAELQAIETLCRRYLREYKREAEILTETDPLRVLEYGREADILVLDVEMEGKSGLAVKDELAIYKDSPLIIFATSHPEVMPRAFQKNVIGFLLKPLEYEFFAAYLESAFNMLTFDQPISFDDGSYGNTGDILWLAAELGYVEAIMTGHRKKSLGRVRLQDMEDKLSPFGFLRISKGILVNCKYIQRFDLAKGLITLKEPAKQADGSTAEEGKLHHLTVSKRRKSECHAQYLHYGERVQRYV